MKTLRPYKFFTLLQGSPMECLGHVPIPRRRGGGGISLLESYLLIAGLKIVAARRVFEFGTFLGSTTLNMALNSSDETTIFTLDLDEQCAQGVEQDSADAPLTKTHIASAAVLDFIGTPVSHKIKTLTGNSITFDFHSYEDSMDLVFIDGGHDLLTVKVDTKNAFEMARRDRASCIIWHDYQNKDYPDLTSYLESLSATRQLFHIGDAMLCVWLNDTDETLITRMLSEDRGPLELRSGHGS